MLAFEAQFRYAKYFPENVSTNGWTKLLLQFGILMVDYHFTCYAHMEFLNKHNIITYYKSFASVKNVYCFQCSFPFSSENAVAHSVHFWAIKWIRLHLPIWFASSWLLASKKITKYHSIEMEGKKAKEVNVLSSFI